jgi:hypothetical protein
MTDIATSSQPGTEALAIEDRAPVRPARFGGVSELPVVRGIVDVTMVGLLGGGPRLAIRAARVLLADSYAARSSADREPTFAAGGPGRDD